MSLLDRPEETANLQPTGNIRLLQVRRAHQFQREHYTLKGSQLPQYTRF